MPNPPPPPRLSSRSLLAWLTPGEFGWFRAIDDGRKPDLSRLQDRDLDSLHHPAATQEPSPAAVRIWWATCRVSTPKGGGSGFFVEGGEDGTLVVTNAHVVDGCHEVTIEWMADGGLILQGQAELLAIDYPHDLAMLKSGKAGSLERVLVLKLGSSPYPGETITMCGYPHGVQTPRLTRGLVSGYDKYRCVFSDCSVTSVVLDMSVNPGNSGGPICDEHDEVIGVASALRHQALLISPASRDLPEEKREMLRALAQYLNTPTGIGFALDPKYVTLMLDGRKGVPSGLRDPIRKFPPQDLPMSRKDFVGLQEQWLNAPRRPDGSSVIGPYSLDASAQYYLGWYSTPSEFPISAPVGWRRIASSIGRTGGSFFLCGYHIYLYRQKTSGYGGYYVDRVKLQIVD